LENVTKPFSQKPLSNKTTQQMNITLMVLYKVYISFVNLKTKMAATTRQFIIHAAFIENVKLEVHLSLYRSPGYSCRLWQFCLSCWGPLVYLFPKTSIIWLPNLLIMSTHMGFLLCPLKYTSLLLTHPHHFVTINNTSTFICFCLLFW
jgi:hypothetical protein